MGRHRGLWTALAGASLLLGACAQAPAEAPVDPLYDKLAQPAEQLARDTVQQALETKRSRTSLSWLYAQDGSKGEITPLRTYRSTTGYYCREYREVVVSAGDGRVSRQRTACRDTNGLWKPLRS